MFVGHIFTFFIVSDVKYNNEPSDNNFKS
jgi:hypothetical protein